jgi:hypothetical protein
VLKTIQQQEILMDTFNNTATRIAAATASMIFIASPALAGSPIGGLTVAVTPAGDQLVAGGATRTIVVLDPKTLEVKARHWIGASIVNLAFNKDGSILAVEDTSSKVYLFDTKTWKAKYTLGSHGKMTVLASLDLLAGLNNAYKGGTIFLNSMKDGSNLGEIKLEAKERVDAMGFSRDGKKLAVILDEVKTPDEKEVKYSDIPKDLRGEARDEFRQRNDGKMSTFRVYEVPSGKKLSEGRTYFSLGTRGQVAFDGDTLVALSYSSYGARIPANGDAKMFKTKNSYNYGLALFPDGTAWISGGLRNYSITSARDMSNKGSGQLRSLPSWPEYFQGFSVTADNKAIYGGTTAYRVVKIGPDGKLIKSEPIR